MPHNHPCRMTVVGAGLMGTAMAKAFASAGHDVVVWNRTHAKACAVAGGTTAVQDLVHALTDRDVVVVSLNDYDSLFDAMATREVEAVLSGLTIVQLSSGTPSDARRGLAWASSIGASYLDGAVLAFPSGVGTDDATVYYSGDPTVFDKHESLLRTLAQKSVFVDEGIGAAAALDCAVLEGFYGGAVALMHAAAILRSESIDPKVLFDNKDAVLTLVSLTADAAATMIAAKDYTGAESPVSTHSAAIAHIVQLSQDAMIDASFPGQLLAQFRRVIEAGGGHLELPALFETMMDPALATFTSERLNGPR